jgi:phosphomannomutase
MALIKSISGIRGTIGGRPGEGLSPVDVVKFTAGYASWVREKVQKRQMKIVVGRDARISGEMVSSIVIATLQGMGCHVINIGLATTPTTELAVTEEQADGGLILTASHNPKHWNALKLLNGNGEFLNANEGARVLELAESGSFEFAGVDELGKVTEKDYTAIHIEKVLELELVDRAAIGAAGFSVAVDAVNSVGGIAMPALLKALGVKKVVEINCDPTGHFAHTPEPLPENLAETSEDHQEQQCRCRFCG